ncbi:MAG TPA: hypothetical protein VN969_28780 [Streptosporangiaceae bacterium]|nr:hypothetical protein [Streptosporangiaceae bacterium]
MVEVVGCGELTDVAPVAVIAVVSSSCRHGSLVIAGRQSQTVDVAGAGPLLAGEVAADEHAAASREAASSPAATAANR